MRIRGDKQRLSLYLERVGMEASHWMVSATVPRLGMTEKLVRSNSELIVRREQTRRTRPEGSDGDDGNFKLMKRWIPWATMFSN